MSSKDSLGDRIKKYEDAYRFDLPIRMPVIIRLDGRNFSSYTRKFEKPYDIRIRDAFIFATKLLFEEIQGLKISYQQSDELTLLLVNYETFDTQPWFMNTIQKMVSVSSSILTAGFNQYMFQNEFNNRLATFDSRVFILPKEEVCNAFLWRERDMIRNSISCLGQKHFSQKALNKKSSIEIKEMLSTKGIDWDEQPTWMKRGYCMTRKTFEKSPGVVRSIIEPDFEIPTFSEYREYINRFVNIGE